MGDQAPEVWLYGAPASLYTAKVRACLLARRISFVERFPSHARYRTVIRSAVESHRIPVAEFADGTIVQDSTLILDELDRRWPDPVAAAMGPCQRLAALLIECVADRGLARAAMHYRWSFPETNEAFVVGEFGRSLRFPAGDAEVERLGRKVAAKMSSYLPRLGIGRETQDGIEADHRESLARLEAHFAAHPYVLGGAPTRADFALMGPLFGHLARDPHPLQLMQQTAPLVFRWTERINWGELASPEFPDRPRALPAGDEVPQTLIAWVRHLLDGGYAETLCLTAERLAAWAGDHPDAPAGSWLSPEGEDQPSLGPITVRRHGARVEEQALAHPLWLLQRATDFVAALEGAERQAAEALAREMGAGDVIGIRLARRLTRVRNRLALA